MFYVWFLFFTRKPIIAIEDIAHFTNRKAILRSERSDFKEAFLYCSALYLRITHFKHSLPLNFSIAITEMHSSITERTMAIVHFPRTSILFDAYSNHY